MIDGETTVIHLSSSRYSPSIALPAVTGSTVALDTDTVTSHLLISSTLH